MNPLSPSLSVRPAEAEDLAFIYATWLNSLRHDSYLGKKCRNTVFYREYPKIIDSILAGEKTKVLVAFFEDVPNVILSYVVFEPKLLHYAFTKEVYRRHGLFKHLLKNAFTEQMAFGGTLETTHLTGKGSFILTRSKSLPRVEFNPFKLFHQLHLKGNENEILQNEN